MIKRSMVFTLLLAFLSVLLLSGIIIASDAPEKIIIKNPAYSKYMKGPVTLHHKKHHDDYGVACTECHHVYENGQNVWKEGDPVKDCAECHPMDKNDGKLYKLKAGTAYHKNCRDCHKEMKKGPSKKCDECHGPKE